jgi:ParB/RepB/Spo0J family partition protein
MATKEKKAKAVVAKAEAFSDKTGYRLAIGDQVRYDHPTSMHSGGMGILVAIHPRQDSDTPAIATVQLDKLDTWKTAPDIPAFGENLTFEGREGFAVGERARVVWEDGKLRPQVQAYTGREGRVASVLENIPFPNIVLLEFDDATLEDRDFQATDLLRTAMAPALPEPPPIEEDSDLPFLNNQAQAEMRNVPLADIIVTSNTRKIFDEAELQGLADSIKAQGVIAPITVRPHGTEAGKFELVAGERRLRASKLAEQQTIPAVIRTLTDREFLEIQLLENLQRVDVRPADEAHAFSKLLKNDFSAEEVALKVGKPVKFVLQRAKLVTLVPFWMELLEADRLPLVAAQELARLPMHSQVVVKKWMESHHAWELNQGKVLDAGNIRHAINQEVMRQLVSAAFPKDDATLCLAAGPCTTCPKNSANSRGLFDEAGADPQAGKCLDAACFGEKKEAFLKRRKKEFSGTDVPQISTSYNNPPAGALGYKLYDRAKEGDKGAVPALVVDGLEAGAINWVKLSKGAANAEAVVQDSKAERAAAMLKNRVSRMKNELWASKLRDTFTTELAMQTFMGGSPDGHQQAAHALLDHWLRRSFTFGRTRTPNDLLAYLVQQYGWEEPTGTDLDNSWQSLGLNGHDKYINRQLAAMSSVLDKVGLFFDLKIRDGLEQSEVCAGQYNLVQSLPKSYQSAFDITAEAEQAVQQRYYSKGKKQEATA